MEGPASYLTKAASLCRKYGLDADALDRDAALVQDYHVGVAVLGAFNTGKSALINALLGTRLVQVCLHEETPLPVEILYGSRGVTVVRDGRDCRADPSVLRAGSEGLAGAELARVALPLPALARLPALSLVDTPGIGTQAARSALMSAPVRQAGAYILVFGADSPVITESMAAVLSALPLSQKPVLCVLTKCDQFAPEQLGRIAEYLEQSLHRQLGLRASLCRAQCTGAPVVDGVPEFLDALQVQAGAMRDAEARRCLARDTAPLIRYLEERLQSSRLLEPELARKADLLDERLSRLHAAVDEMNERSDAQVEHTAAGAARRSRETLAPLAAPLAELIAAGQDPAPFADGAVLSVLHAAVHSRMLPVLLAYENAMRRLAGLYGLEAPPCDAEELRRAAEGAYPGTGDMFAGADPDPQTLLDGMQRLVESCLTQGGRDAFVLLRDTLSRPLYDQLGSLRKALEDARRQQHEQTEASQQSLEGMDADLALLRRFCAPAEEECAHDV